MRWGSCEGDDDPRDFQFISRFAVGVSWRAETPVRFLSAMPPHPFCKLNTFPNHSFPMVGNQFDFNWAAGLGSCLFLFDPPSIHAAQARRVLTDTDYFLNHTH